jgi:hypothetical protein
MTLNEENNDNKAAEARDEWLGILLCRVIVYGFDISATAKKMISQLINRLAKTNVDGKTKFLAV